MRGIAFGIIVGLLAGCDAKPAKTIVKPVQATQSALEFVYTGPQTYQQVKTSHLAECMRGQDIVCILEAKTKAAAPLKTVKGESICIEPPHETTVSVMVEYSRDTEELIGVDCNITQHDYDQLRQYYRAYRVRALPSGVKAIREKEEIESYSYKNQSIAVYKRFGEQTMKGIQFDYHLYLGNTAGLFE